MKNKGKTKKRIIIFCDHANVFHNLGDIRIDYKMLKDLLKNNDHLVGALLYDGLPEIISLGKKKFLNYLRTIGWVSQTKPIKTHSDGSKTQDAVDEYLFNDIVELAADDAFDKAILISGDKDFLEAIKELKLLKKEIELWSFKRSISITLIEELGEKNVKFLDDILSVIRYRKFRTRWITSLCYLRYKIWTILKKVFKLSKDIRRFPPIRPNISAKEG